MPTSTNTSLWSRCLHWVACSPSGVPKQIILQVLDELTEPTGQRASEPPAVVAAPRSTTVTTHTTNETLAGSS